MRKSGENITFFINSNMLSNYLVPEREHVCPPTTVQLPRTNTTSGDNTMAMSVDCGDSVPTITKGATPSEHYYTPAQPYLCESSYSGGS